VLPLFYDADLIDDDGLPVSALAAGDRLPGGARAWERLGVGRRCETWLAWSTALCAPVVVKFPRPHQVGTARARDALYREVRALHGTLHPGLPVLYRDGTNAGVPYVELEYLDGPCLDEEVADRGRLDPVETALLGVQLLAALRSVHARELLHVDIKPANVVLRAGCPVLLDFGSSRPIGAAQPAGALIGSPGYAAPELEDGAPLAAPMDLYGVGATLYEALAGCPAFEPELAAADRPEAKPPDDTAVSELVIRLLAPDPAARPTLAQAVNELVRLCADAGVPPWPVWARA
jgi:eukaryotic-like serine/threonine-protein kinase